MVAEVSLLAYHLKVDDHVKVKESTVSLIKVVRKVNRGLDDSVTLWIKAWPTCNTVFVCQGE